GMDRMAEKWAEALLELFGQNLHTIYKKGREKNQVVLRDEIFFKGNQEETMIMENGCQFLVNWKSGQKTGFFLDQRDNRNLIRNYASGRRVLNTFCYSGGFSVYALAAGATSVHSVDVSVKAIDWANENIKINGFSDRVHKSFVGDSMKFMLETDSDYDLIVLDPPAFAKHLSAKHNAIQGYRRLNEVAIRNIHQGGIIFTFSCSQVVDQQLFESTVCAAAISVGRKVRILHRLSQPADHPVSIFHPEGEYLKGLVLHIE
ncbi:class I SAM-dependent methyltransferase, partial [Patescibacteria group bacterium]|nr:class I SAM-dependent methyltransferase [Patescibacteria group bacterium]